MQIKTGYCKNMTQHIVFRDCILIKILVAETERGKKVDYVIIFFFGYNASQIK